MAQPKKKAPHLCEGAAPEFETSRINQQHENSSANTDVNRGADQAKLAALDAFGFGGPVELFTKAAANAGDCVLLNHPDPIVRAARRFGAAIEQVSRGETVRLDGQLREDFELILNAEGPA